MILKSIIRNYWLLILIAILKIVMQYVLVNPIYEPHRDEFLYLDQSFHPAVGYISVPPFTSWVASLIHLLGNGLFWVRFFPALFGAGTIVFAWLIVEEIGGKYSAKILTSSFLLFSILLRMNVLFQPNSFDILAWTMVFYFVLKYIRLQQFKWLLWLSLAIALGWYNKYNMAFLLAGLLVGITLSSHRRLLITPAFYWATGMTFLLILPNLIWQISHQFPAMHHMQALDQLQLVHVNRIDFIIDQFKYGLIGILTLGALVAMIIYKPFQSYRWIGWTFVAVILLYVLSRGKSYYAIGLYPVMFALGSVYLEQLFKRWQPIWVSSLVVMNVAVFFSIVKFLMPFQSPQQISASPGAYEKLGLLRWEDGQNHPLPQDFSDMIGWHEMADKALAAYQQIPSHEYNQTLVYCDNYGQAGALNYYNRGLMPEAYSFNTDYIYWLPPQQTIKNMVFVGQLPDKDILALFHECRVVGTVENEYAREKGTLIFLLLGADDSITQVIHNLANERKQNFNIF